MSAGLNRLLPSRLSESLVIPILDYTNAAKFIRQRRYKLVHRPSLELLGQCAFLRLCFRVHMPLEKVLVHLQYSLSYIIQP